MHPQKRTTSGLGFEMMISAGGAGRRPRHGSISFATEAVEEAANGTWKVVVQATGWKATQRQRVHISGLFLWI